MIALELTHPDGSPSQGSAREEPPVTWPGERCASPRRRRRRDSSPCRQETIAVGSITQITLGVSGSADLRRIEVQVSVVGKVRAGRRPLGTLERKRPAIGRRERMRSGRANRPRA